MPVIPLKLNKPLGNITNGENSDQNYVMFAEILILTWYEYFAHFTVAMIFKHFGQIKV